MKTKDVATRRRFVLDAGVALAAPAALGVAAAADAREPTARGPFDARLAALEDTQAVRDLQRAYARHVSAREHAAAAELFAQPARASFDDAVRGLHAETLADDVTIEIAADRRSAIARAACVVRIEAPIDAPGCTLVEMARAQGEGVVRRSERRVLEQTFVRSGGVWKIDDAALREPG
jgi:hypothetical protein